MEVGHDGEGLVVCVIAWGHGGAGDSFAEEVGEVGVSVGAVEFVGEEIDVGDGVAVLSVAAGAIGQEDLGSALYIGGCYAVAFLGVEG